MKTMVVVMTNGRVVLVSRNYFLRRLYSRLFRNARPVRRLSL